MPQFTPWTVTDPTPNVLFNPIAAAQAAATTQSTLGDLAINQAKLGIEQQKLDATRAGNAALVGNGTMPGTTDATTTTGGGTGGAGAGDGSFMSALANIESGDKNIVSGTDTDSKGLTVAQGGDPSEISQGHFQIQTATWRDFAKQAGIDLNQYPNAMSAPREIQARVASVIPFSRFGPRTQALMRQQFGDIDSSQTVGVLAGLGPRMGPRVAGNAPIASVDPNAPLPVPPIPPAVVPPPFNPNAGPRVAGASPPGAPGADPNAPPPVTTGQADPANMAAVKQAASGLLAMPEADAATAYPGVVKDLQARGFAMNAPAEYPGHAALQALVNGGTAPVPVTPSPIAARTGGTDMAGPGAGPDTMPAVPSPNRLYETGLPGVQITAPGNPLAPPGTAQAPVTAPDTGSAPVAPGAAATPPGAATRPPVPIPPPAPSRMIQTAPLIKGGPMDGLTANQALEAQQMGRSLVPTADLAKQMEVWRQQNIANAQTAATANAAQQTLDATRQQQYYENQVKAGWEDAGNGMIRNRYTGETKYAGPPSPRFGPETVDPATGQPAIPMAGGGAGLQLLPVPNRPADAGYVNQKDAYHEELPQITQAAEQAQNARTSQIRWQTMLDLANQLRTGAGGATRAQLANLLDTAGLPGAQTLIAHTNDGDAAAAQEFTKLATQAAGADARADLGSRAGLGAIRLFQSANPNLDLRPGANKNIIGMQLIAAQADADYNNAKVAYGNQQQDSFFKGGPYQPLSRFDQQWQTQRNPQVYAAAMGALQGQPASTWANGLSDDEYKRALDVVSRASPSATVNAKSGRISMQPGGQTGSSSAPAVALPGSTAPTNAPKTIQFDANGNRITTP